jgi:hypothetical protein
MASTGKNSHHSALKWSDALKLKRGTNRHYGTEIGLYSDKRVHSKKGDIMRGTHRQHGDLLRGQT